MRLLLLLPLVAANQQYCKCECNGVVLTDKIDDCAMCTSEWCLEKKADICGGSKTEEVRMSCSQKESPKEKFIVFVYVLAVAGLLAGTLVKT